MAMGPFSLWEKDRMRERKWWSYSDPLTLALSRREREFRCPTPNFVPNTIGGKARMGVASRTAVLATPLGTPFLTFPPDGGKEPGSETPHLAVAYL
jgi:hypothetical protein